MAGCLERIYIRKGENETNNKHTALSAIMQSGLNNARYINIMIIFIHQIHGRKHIKQYLNDNIQSMKVALLTKSSCRTKAEEEENVNQNSLNESNQI